MSRVFIGVGSNKGDRSALIRRAVQALGRVGGTQVVQLATMLETDPMGGPPQGPFLNTVAELDTTLEPEPLLEALQAVERRLGRRPSSQCWAARPIDLDLLLYDERIINTPSLTIPHPRMHLRRFVLEPLAQLAPGVRHPILHETVSVLLSRLCATAPARA